MYFKLIFTLQLHIASMVHRQKHFRNFLTLGKGKIVLVYTQ